MATAVPTDKEESKSKRSAAERFIGDDLEADCIAKMIGLALEVRDEHGRRIGDRKKPKPKVEAPKSDEPSARDEHGRSVTKSCERNEHGNPNRFHDELGHPCSPNGQAQQPAPAAHAVAEAQPDKTGPAQPVVDVQPSQTNPTAVTPPAVAPEIDPENVTYAGGAELGHITNSEGDITEQVILQKGNHESGPVFRWAAFDNETGEEIDGSDWSLGKAEALQQGKDYLEQKRAAAKKTSGPSEASTPSRPEVLERLTTSPIAKATNLGGGANKSEKVQLEDGTVGVWKPVDGEDPGLRDGIKAGTYYLREAASSAVADLLGFADLVPATAVREHDGKQGSIQQWVSGAKEAVHFHVGDEYDGEHDLARAALFDYLTGNGDRHWANWMLTGEDKLVLIDNGLSFPSGAGDYKDFRTVALTDHARKKRLPMPDITGMKEKWPEVESELKRLGIDEPSIAFTKKRWDVALSGKYKKINELPDLAEPDGFDEVWGSEAKL